MSNILTTRVQSFSIDDVDYSLQAASATIKGTPGDFRPLGAAAPDSEYSIEITAGQDLTAASLWHMAFTEANTEVLVMMRPYGNDDAPTALKPWVYTIATIAEPDGDLIGGGPEKSTTSKRTFAITWPCERPVPIYSVETIPEPL
jgi:hypothetical protein